MAILALQAYLVLAPNGGGRRDGHRPAGPDVAPFLDAHGPSGAWHGAVLVRATKRGQGAAGDVQALLGDAVFDCDVWLNTGDHDRLRRVAESLAARVWGADRSFFLVNGSSSGNHACWRPAPATR